MMEVLRLKPTKETPDVILDKENNIFKITGLSLPEDVKEFYNPIIDWFKNYFLAPNEETRLHLNLVYINSASSKMIYEIFQMFKQMHRDGTKVSILWQYNYDDEEMGDAGEDFAVLLDGVPFEVEALYQ